MSPPRRYRTFELEITPGDESYRARVLASPAGEIEGAFFFPFEQSEWQDLAAIPPEETGARIFDALFFGPVGECWRSSLALLGADEGLRLNLRIPDAPELTALPWELLYDTTQHHFLALTERTPINRYLPLPLAQEDLAVEPPLRVLVILSAPVDHEPHLDVELEWQGIQAALAPLVESGQIEIVRLAQATWSELQSTLRKQTIHILHFVGHGLFDERQGGGLLFEDEDGFLQLISARKLTHLLRNHPSLRLALLNSCDGAVTRAETPFAGMAQALVQQGIPSVIAMQQEISDRASLIFGPEFYAAVADGYPVDAALAQARMAVYAEDDSEWATPVLFMRAADGQLFNLNGTIEERKSAPRLKVPAPTQPPVIDSFVPREMETAYHIEQLESENIAVITGLPGVGKTTLAAIIARQMGEQLPVFWHAFHEAEQSDVLIWKLAAFLAWHDRPALWEMLSNASTSSGNLPPPETLFDFLLELLTEQAILICLDNFQYVDRDPLILRTIERLHHLFESNNAKLLVITRRIPTLGVVGNYQRLTGLRVEEIRHLLDQNNLTLDDALVAELHRKTDGNPQLLTLAINLLQQGQYPDELVESLTTNEDIERFLLDGIDANLSQLERDVLSAVAVFQDETCTRDALETVLDSEQGLLRTLNELSTRHLLTTSQTPNGRSYSENQSVGSFYYGLLAVRRRKEMHRRAGDYFESVELDILASLRQYRAADEFEHFARVLFANLTLLLSQGQALTVQLLLEQIPQQRLSQPAQIQISEARGDILYLLGSLDESIQSFAQALHLATGDKPLQIRLARKQGDVLTRKGDYDLARQSYRQASDLLSQTDLPEEHALLSVGIGTLGLSIGEYDEIMAEVQDELARSSAAVNPLVVAELHDLAGKAYYFKGDLANSTAHFEAAHARREAANDLRGVLRSHSNLAVVYGAQQRLDDAVRTNQSALEIAEKIGDVVALTLIYTNLAADYSELGQYEQAIEFHTKSLHLAERMGNVQGLRLAHQNLGDVYRLITRFDEAFTHITHAIEMADQVNDTHVMIGSRYGLALLYFDQNDMDSAARLVRHALQIATEAGDLHWLPRCEALMERINERK